ncbi:helix-turn-helix transcriptional regulator [Tepidibacter thalassicus]|uniref:helix-turn-helix transcriptional regulator n=1 Tax=Tepidibacter thalassicus TaxID=214905 RepID=UPI000933B85D|nr:helix-turn-helix transcriptional regulator [Tepidibacter thalassicus]
MPDQNAIPKLFIINYYKELYSHIDEKTIGSRIRKSRLSKGLSQLDLSRLTGLSEGAIHGYETNTIHPSKSALEKLGQVLNLNYICSDGYSKFLLSNYPEKLRMWRNKKNISMIKASEILGVGKSTYASWENETYSVSKNYYYKLIHFFKKL